MDFIFTTQNNYEDYETDLCRNEDNNSLFEELENPPTRRKNGAPAELSKYAFLHNEFFD